MIFENVSDVFVPSEVRLPLASCEIRARDAGALEAVGRVAAAVVSIEPTNAPCN